LVGAAILSLVLSTWAVAQAASGDRNPNNLPREASTIGPNSVAGTAAGMPPTAQVRFMVVNADGTKARSFPSAISFTSTRLATGTYDVRFGLASITGCAFIGTIGLSGTSGTSAPGEITVVGRAGAPNGIFVQTFNSAGGLADLGFHILVAC